MRHGARRSRADAAIPALAAHGTTSELAAELAADRAIAGRFSGNETHGAPAEGMDEMRAQRAEAAMRDGGAALPGAERRFFEARFGRDLSSIQQHADDRAGGAARGIGAAAYTLGNHIAFAPGRYVPETPAGRHTVGHEIAHALQQRTLARPVIQRQKPKANADIANLPWVRHLDAFKEVTYDLDYRAAGGHLSTWLTVTYHDGAQIDIALSSIADRDAPYLESWANGYLGKQGRVFPSDLTRTTAPRLWAAKQEAIAIMEEYNYNFMLTALPAVIFIISLAAAPPVGSTPVVRRMTRPRPAIRTPAPAAAAPKTAAPAAAAPAAAAVSAGGSSFRIIGSKVLRYGGRDVVVVETSAGRQAYYRCTGLGGANKGGAQAGDWALFDGVLAGWFDKSRYAVGSADDVLYRFGTKENKAASEWLATQAIKAGDDVGDVFSIVNQYLKDLGALKLGGAP
jgi:hypothetical protein